MIIPPDAHSRSTLQWPEFMRAGVAPDAPGMTFDPCLSPQPGDIELVKQRYSAFVGTRLDEILRGRGIVSVIVLGQGYWTTIHAFSSLRVPSRIADGAACAGPRSVPASKVRY